MIGLLVALRRIAFAVLSVLIVVVGLGCPRLAAAQTTPTEIIELARALKYDPDLIYEYVYNNIETLPQYGSLKGPLGALLDGKGTPFDQAELMVALLQEAGFSAAFAGWSKYHANPPRRLPNSIPRVSIGGSSALVPDLQ